MSATLLEPEAAQAAPAKVSIIDCDIHPALRSFSDYNPYLSKRWREHLASYGGNIRQPLTSELAYPRMSPGIARLDAWPPVGGPPGSDLAFMRAQHLDPMGVERGMLIPLQARANSQRNLDFAAALASAANDWQLDTWLGPEPRLRGSIIVAHEDSDAAVAEIERRADDPSFVQVLIPPRSTEPLGRRRYWSIYRAAERLGLPIAIHIGGAHGLPCTASGWASYYFEEHHSNVQSIEAMVTSMTVEGVFEAFPALRVLLIESGFAWVPALCWRLDQHWRRLKSEVPHLRRAPSEYIRSNIFYTTQPLDEPERPGDLARIIEWVGIDRILFATDYPHWDFDDPHVAFNGKLGAADKEQIFRGNARTFYRMD